MDARGVIDRLLRAGQHDYEPAVPSSSAGPPGGGRPPLSPPTEERGGARGTGRSVGTQAAKTPTAPDAGDAAETAPEDDRGPTEETRADRTQTSPGGERGSAAGEEAPRRPPPPASSARESEREPEAPRLAPAPDPERSPELDSGSILRLQTAAELAESFGLGFHLAGAVERITFAAVEGAEGVHSLREAAWLIDRYIELVEDRPQGADLHRATLRLARTGGTIAGLKSLADALAEERASDEPAATPTPAAAAGVEPTVQHPAPPVTDPAAAEPPAAQERGAGNPPAPPTLRRELLLTTYRWGLLVVAVVVVVLALTLIGQWL